jgi:hypothetical protein
VLEVDAIHTRCKECGAATRVVRRQDEWNGSGWDTVAVWSEDVPHNRADCKAMVALMREQWPTLW